MTVDTLRIGADVTVSSWGWVDRELVSTDRSTGCSQVKLISLGRDGAGNVLPRLTFMYDRMSADGMRPDAGHLLAEVSLPKFFCGHNHELLSDDNVRRAVLMLIAWTEDQIGAVEDYTWSISRLDAVYSWDVGADIGYYFDALGSMPVTDYVRSPYVQDDGITQGLSWRCKSRRVNAYDKGLECKLALNGRLRLEVQALNRAAVKSVMERQGVSGLASDVSGDLARAEVRAWLSRLGMTDKIFSRSDVLESLITQFGYEGAKTRYFFLEGYRRLGTRLKTVMSNSSYAHIHAEAVQAGWFCSADRELPGLVVPV